ncbi:helix-turn-helix transcriptional regulator [Burkholderia gladioli]|uniref:helix-turn-helix transcriptional regulator n=1 Tax=Burkholderia gladioli TaxID=28095 RepID=UPI00163E6EC2|nr:helix-turn-helix transcriptional regulator [Burkholderia gladioli]
MSTKNEYRRWSAEDEQKLREIWHAPGPLKSFVDLFEGRTESALSCHGLEMGLGRRGNRYMYSGDPTANLILSVLACGAMDSVEIAAKAGIARETAMKHLKRLHLAGRIHIARWERFARSGYPSKVWSAGPGTDASRPVPRTPGQKFKDRMQRLKKEQPDEYSRVVARRRAGVARRAGRPVKRDIAAIALFGGASA